MGKRNVQQELRTELRKRIEPPYEHWFLGNDLENLKNCCNELGSEGGGSSG